MIGNIFTVHLGEWMIYISSFGGIFLTFLAGAETDIKLMRLKFKESFLLGLTSFLIPFITVFLFSYYLANWSFLASLIAGVALSETGVAVVYFVLIENELANTEIGKTIGNIFNSIT